MLPVPRPRLFTKLDEARAAHGAIALIAPAGAGKTTLVASWLDARELAGIWFRVDRDDAEPATFFHYLREACRSFADSDDLLPPVLTPEYRADVPRFARRFFRSLFAILPADAAVVLDNFQDAGDGTTISSIVALALDEVPPGVSVVIISRHELPDAFAHARSRDQLHTLGADSLRLTLEEATAIAATRRQVDERSVRDLFERSAGWAAGLTLMLQAVADGETPRRGADVPGSEQVFAFLADQVFDGMSPQEQRFLTHIACLSHVNGPMAEALTGDPQAPELLQQFFRRQFFLHRSVGRDGSFHLHALFREFLNRRAGDLWSIDEWRGMQRHAAAVCAAYAMFDEALDLFLGIQAWEEALAVFSSVLVDRLEQGRYALLRRWIAALPEALADSTPDVQYALGTMAAGDDPTLAIRQLTAAYEAHRTRAEPLGSIRAASALIEVIFHSTTDHRAMVPWISVLEDFERDPPAALDPELRLRMHAAMLVARLFASPRDPELAHTAQATLELLVGEASANRRLLSTVFLTIYATFTGHFELAPLLTAHGDRLADHPAVTPHARANWLLWKTYLMRLLGRYEEGAVAVSEAWEIATREGFGQIRFLAAYFRSGLESSHGDLKTAGQWEREAAALADPSRQLQRALLAACSAWLSLYRNDPAGAKLHGQLAMGTARSLAAPSYRIHYGTPLVFGLVESREFGEADAVIAEQRAAVSGTAIGCFEPLFLAAEARMRELVGDDAGARHIVQTLWRVAARQDHGRFLSWLKPWMPRFCEWGLSAGVEAPYIRMLIREFGWKPLEGFSDAWPWRVRVYGLGTFRVVVNDEPPSFGRKMPRRPLELLRALIARGTAYVAEHDLADHLWPDEEADAAHKSLASALHRLRALLGSHDAVELLGGRVRLNPELVWTDVCALNHHLRASPSNDQADRVAALYHGALFPDDQSDTWVLSARRRIAQTVTTVFELHARCRERDGHPDEARLWYERALQIDDTRDDLHRGLMRVRQTSRRDA